MFEKSTPGTTTDIRFYDHADASDRHLMEPFHRLHDKREQTVGANYQDYLRQVACRPLMGEPSQMQGVAIVRLRDPSVILPSAGGTHSR